MVMCYFLVSEHEDIVNSSEFYDVYVSVGKFYLQRDFIGQN